MTSPTPLAEERQALRHILERLMTENFSLEDLCKYIPRIASVSANVTRIDLALVASSAPDASEALFQALRELGEELEEAAKIDW